MTSSTDSATSTQTSDTPDEPTIKTRQPAIYIPHGGGPWPFVPDPDNHWGNLGDWLATLPTYFPTKPEAVVVISAHWEADDFSVASGPSPQLIYDYYNFPESTYSLKYDAPGSASVAARLVELADEAGMTLQAEPEYGWDHGVFVPMAVSFPEADTPIVAVSLRKGLDPETHMKFGRALAQIRSENVAVVGSGLSIHDLQFKVTPEASGAFDVWLEEAMLSPATTRNERLRGWAEAPGARASHPREEHLLPLMVVAGMAGADDAVRRVFTDDFFGSPVAAYCVDQQADLQ